MWYKKVSTEKPYDLKDLFFNVVNKPFRFFCTNDGAPAKLFQLGGVSATPMQTDGISATPMKLGWVSAPKRTNTRIGLSLRQ